MVRIIEILVCIICSALPNDQSHIKVETAMIGNNKVNMVLPKPYHIQTLYECDGHAVIYSFPDGGSIIINGEGLLEFPSDAYVPDYTYSMEDRSIKTGMKDKNHWRIDRYKTIKVYYINVQNKDKDKYDSILDNVWIDSND